MKTYEARFCFNCGKLMMDAFINFNCGHVYCSKSCSEWEKEMHKEKAGNRPIAIGEIPNRYDPCIDVDPLISSEKGIYLTPNSWKSMSDEEKKKLSNMECQRNEKCFR
jgi:hypothetical protein